MLRLIKIQRVIKQVKASASPMASEQEELKLLIFELLNDYEREGKLDDLETIYNLAKRISISNADAENWIKKYKIETSERRTEGVSLQHREIKSKYDTEKMRMDICPNCMNLRSQLNEKDRDFREVKSDLKQDLREAKTQLEQYKHENLKLIKSEAEAETFKARVRELETLVNDLRNRLDSEKDNRHKLEVKSSVLEVRNEMISNRDPDEDIVHLRKLIYEKGFARMTGDDPSSETLQVIRSVGEMAPAILKEGAEIISKIRSDKDPNANPYPQGDQQYMKYQQQQARRQQQQQRRRNPPRQPAPQQPPPRQAPPPRAPQENLNDLGKAFNTKYPKIPLDLVGPVSDHIFSVYNHLSAGQMAVLMNNTFVVVTNLREAGIHIKNMMAGKV